MRIFLALGFILFSVIVYGKTIKVNVKINNQTNEILTVYIESSENVGSTNVDNKITKVLNPGESHEENIDAEKYSMICGYSILKKGGRTATKYKLVSKKKDIFTYNITIEDGENKTLIDLTNTDKILEYTPEKFLDSDKSPKPLPGLFTNYLGGLVAYTDSNGIKTKVTSISPYNLKTMMDPSSASIGTGQNSKEISFVNQNVQDIKANIPMAAQLGVVWNNSSLYNVKIEYKNIGVIDWKDKAGQLNISRAFRELDIYLLADLGYHKLINPKLKLKQINQAYVFDGVFIEVKQGSDMSSSTNIDASTFFTNSGNFKISKNSIDKKVYGSSYLGYWFNELSPDLTGSLQYALAVYYSINNGAYTNKTDKEAVDEYQKLRLVNSALPDLKTKKEIQEYYKAQVEEYKKLNPETKADKKLSSITLLPSDPINQLSDEQLISKFNDLFMNKGLETSKMDIDAIKIILKNNQMEKVIENK